MNPIDMSPRAITMRIRRAAQLRNLCLSLAKAGSEARKAAAADEDSKARALTRNPEAPPALAK